MLNSLFTQLENLHSIHNPTSVNLENHSSQCINSSNASVPFMTEEYMIQCAYDQNLKNDQIECHLTQIIQSWHSFYQNNIVHSHIQGSWLYEWNVFQDDLTKNKICSHREMQRLSSFFVSVLKMKHFQQIQCLKKEASNINLNIQQEQHVLQNNINKTNSILKTISLHNNHQIHSESVNGEEESLNLNNQHYISASPSHASLQQNNLIANQDKNRLTRALLIICKNFSALNEKSEDMTEATKVLDDYLKMIENHHNIKKTTSLSLQSFQRDDMKNLIAFLNHLVMIQDLSGKINYKKCNSFIKKYQPIWEEVFDSIFIPVKYQDMIHALTSDQPDSQTLQKVQTHVQQELLKEVRRQKQFLSTTSLEQYITPYSYLFPLRGFFDTIFISVRDTPNSAQVNWDNQALNTIQLIANNETYTHEKNVIKNLENNAQISSLSEIVPLKHQLDNMAENIYFYSQQFSRSFKRFENQVQEARAQNNIKKIQDCNNILLQYHALIHALQWVTNFEYLHHLCPYEKYKTKMYLLQNISIQDDVFNHLFISQIDDKDSENDEEENLNLNNQSDISKNSESSQLLQETHVTLSQAKRILSVKDNRQLLKKAAIQAYSNAYIKNLPTLYPLAQEYFKNHSYLNTQAPLIPEPDSEFNFISSKSCVSENNNEISITNSSKQSPKPFKQQSASSHKPLSVENYNLLLKLFKSLNNKDSAMSIHEQSDFQFHLDKAKTTILESAGMLLEQLIQKDALYPFFDFLQALSQLNNKDANVYHHPILKNNQQFWESYFNAIFPSLSYQVFLTTPAIVTFSINRALYDYHKEISDLNASSDLNESQHASKNNSHDDSDHNSQIEKIRNPKSLKASIKTQVIKDHLAYFYPNLYYIAELTKNQTDFKIIESVNSDKQCSNLNKQYHTPKAPYHTLYCQQMSSIITLVRQQNKKATFLKKIKAIDAQITTTTNQYNQCIELNKEQIKKLVQQRNQEIERLNSNKMQLQESLQQCEKLHSRVKQQITEQLYQYWLCIVETHSLYPTSEAIQELYIQDCKNFVQNQWNYQKKNQTTITTSRQILFYYMSMIQNEEERMRNDPFLKDGKLHAFLKKIKNVHSQLSPNQQTLWQDFSEETFIGDLLLQDNMFLTEHSELLKMNA